MRFNKRGLNALERLEQRCLLTSATFVMHSDELRNPPEMSQFVDLDNDNDLDLLVKVDSALEWSENRAGEYGPLKTLWNANPLQTFDTGDMNSDGYIDILIGDDQGVRWLVNSAGSRFSEGPVVASIDATILDTVKIVDFDRDDDLDVLFVDSNKAYLSTNAEGYGTPIPIGVLPGEDAYDIQAVDLDLDGDLDVVSSSEDFASVLWFRQLAPNVFSQPNFIARPVTDSHLFGIADMDGDGDMDVVAHSDRVAQRLVWYENDNTGEFGDSHLISTVASSDLLLIDIDNDGDIDVLANGEADDGTGLVVYRNDGEGTFPLNANALAIRRGSFAQFSGKMVANRLELVVSESNGVSILTSSAVEGRLEEVVSLMTGSSVTAQTSADIDGDGIPELVVADSGAIRTFGQVRDNPFAKSHVISRLGSDVSSIDSGDIDGDGDIDVLTLSRKLAWISNEGIDQPFTMHEIDDNDADHATVRLTDLDMDGDLDLVQSAQFAGNSTLAWREFNAESNRFSSPIPIIQKSNGALLFDIADFDSDGDQDVLTAFVTTDGTTLRWQENFDGRGTFVDSVELPDVTGPTHSLNVVDIEQDGELDVVAGGDDGRVHLLQNIAEGASFQLRTHTLNEITDQVFAEVADFDGDGDSDIVAVAVNQGNLAWLEQSSAGTFTSHAITDGRPFRSTVTSLGVGDLNGDQRTDVVISYSNPSVAWLENRLIGDSNGDGEFNSTDLVQIFQTGEYEDSFFGNSTFADGDWNGDGEFNSSDIVYAFQANSYSRQASEVRNHRDGEIQWRRRDRDLAFRP